jgi:hypothetical protein
MHNSIAKMPITGGNLRNHHFYLRTCTHLIPEGGVGGKNREDPGQPFQVMFEPGTTVETDVDGSKMILRNRQAVRDFFKRTGASEGDFVVIERVADRQLLVRLQPA